MRVNTITQAAVQSPAPFCCFRQICSHELYDNVGIFRVENKLPVIPEIPGNVITKLPE